MRSTNQKPCKETFTGLCSLCIALTTCKKKMGKWEIVVRNGNTNKKFIGGCYKEIEREKENVIVSIYI